MYLGIHHNVDDDEDDDEGTYVDDLAVVVSESGITSISESDSDSDDELPEKYMKYCEDSLPLPKISNFERASSGFITRSHVIFKADYFRQMAFSIMVTVATLLAFASLFNKKCRAFVVQIDRLNKLITNLTIQIKYLKAQNKELC